MDPLPILQQRRIEANIMKHVYENLRERFGVEQARDIIREIVSKAAIEQGAGLAEQVDGDPDLKDFFDILPLWSKDGALEIDVLEAGADTLDFNVKRCRYAEMYREMGVGEIGDLLSCQRDGDFCIGYNKDIEFSRTQTIMGGASHCDFRYRLKGGGEA
ncbi:MAG: L-2-amino-thiazoline-4-carboxylic acid hydrolase [Rhodospirillaceae bacterium]|nr:L-2-amino-thiazoline-4-carboxylic acid hydrolase [Rhodospirillaceae bacterium]